MHNILLLRIDEQLFKVEAIQRIFGSDVAFRDVRFHEPGGALIEAVYTEPEDWTIIRLSENCKHVSLSGVSDTALRAALIIQQNYDAALRVVDTDYSFDLVLRDFATIEELRGAIENAQAG